MIDIFDLGRHWAGKGIIFIFMVTIYVPYPYQFYSGHGAADQIHENEGKHSIYSIYNF